MLLLNPNFILVWYFEHLLSLRRVIQPVEACDIEVLGLDFGFLILERNKRVDVQATHLFPHVDVVRVSSHWERLVGHECWVRRRPSLLIRVSCHNFSYFGSFRKNLRGAGNFRVMYFINSQFESVI